MNTEELLTNLTSTAGNIGLMQILPAIIVLIVCIIVRKGILSILKKQLDAHPQSKTIAPALTAIVSVCLTVLTVIIVCGVLNIPMTSLVALLSVFTLAISMAAQGVLANIAGGLSILYSKPFVVGDFVSTSGVDGFVTEIGLFYTRLKTFDQKVVSVPNSTIASAIVTDFSTNPTRRVDLTISASYDDDVDQVMNALLEACKQQDKVLADPAPFVGVLEYGNSSIKYTVRAWCKGADYWDVYFGLQNGFAETFKANGIHMTYDHVNVHMIKED